MPAESSRAVFLSYASQDAEAARRICETLRAAGVEVWFDADGGLEHGDEWDAKIRRQIKECVLFIPIISAHTQARLEGYFRIEWDLAAERARGIASGVPFILPVVIDDTREPEALVPDRFRAVQWTRLPGGVVTPEVKARYLKLWSHRVGAVKDLGARASSPADAVHAGGTPALPGKRRWRGPAIVAALVIVAVASWMFFGRSSPPASNPKPQTQNSKPPSAPAAPTSEARKLVAQARALFEEGDDANHENFFLADDLLKKAVALDGTDGEVWAAQAQLSADMVLRSYDRSAARLQNLRTQAERAVKLAPDSGEAQLAYAGYLTVTSFLTPNAERFATEALDVAAKVKPTASPRRRAAWSQFIPLVVLGRMDEGLVLLERANAQMGGDPMLLSLAANQLVFAGRYAEAEDMVTRAWTLRRIGRTHMLNVLLKLTWRGDLDGAAAALAEWPSWLALEDRGVFLASQVWLWKGEPEKALAVLAPVTRDFLNDSVFVGPKSVLVALAHEMANNPQAARSEWENVRRVAERVAAEQSADQRVLVWKAMALARLGETAEAETIFRQLEQTKVLRSEFWSCAAPSALLRLALGHGGDVVAKFDTELRSNSVRTRPPSPQAALRLNPVFDSIRATPEFQKWMTAAPAPATKTEAAAANVEAKSVAVLAFTNLGDDKDSEYFGEGIGEELLNVLAKIPGLTVKARTSSFSAKLRNATAQEIGQTLKVAHVVNGTLRRNGNSVRVIAHLTRTDTGDEMWTDRFDGDLDKPWALQDQIAARIAEALRVKLTDTTRAARSVNPEAFRLLLEGRHFWNLRTMEGFEKAEAAFAKAIALDPSYAEAHAARADNFQIRAQYLMLDGKGGEASDQARALEEVNIALKLSPNLAEAYVALAYLIHNQGRLAEAAPYYEKVFALNPNHAFAHIWHSQWLDVQGRIADAIAENRLAVELDPLNFIIIDRYADHLMYAHRYAEALAANERAAALRTDVFLPNLARRALQLLFLNRRAEAVETARAVRKYPTAWPRWSADADIIWVLQQCGLTEEAQAHAAEALRILPEQSHLRGHVLANVGKLDEALPFLERGPVLFRRSLFFDEYLDRWRDDPRFQQLIAKLGCSEEYKLGRAQMAQLAAENAGRESGGGELRK